MTLPNASQSTVIFCHQEIEAVFRKAKKDKDLEFSDFKFIDIMKLDNIISHVRISNIEHNSSFDLM